MFILGAVMMMSVVVAILFGGHFFLYIYLLKFLEIQSSSAKAWLGSALFLLSISFIAFSIISHYSEGVFSRIGYLLSGLWLSVGWNLVLFFSLSWILMMILRSNGYQGSYQFFAVFSIVLSLALSAYGIWSAYNPKVEKVNVSIKNLPEKWKDKKIVQLSDVHLGHVYRKDFLEKIIGEANAENPDIVFVTGDLFDGMDGDLDHITEPFNNLHAPDGIYFITGNHETYLGVKNALAALENTPVKVLDNEVVDVDGLQIVGVSYPERGEKFDIQEMLRNIKNFDVAKPNILLYHNPIVAPAARDFGIDLQLAGHTHRGQLFPFQFITRLIYGKYHSGLTQEGDFSIYTSPGVGTWGPTMRTSGRPEIVVIKLN